MNSKARMTFRFDHKPANAAKQRPDTETTPGKSAAIIPLFGEGQPDAANETSGGSGWGGGNSGKDNSRSSSGNSNSSSGRSGSNVANSNRGKSGSGLGAATPHQEDIAALEAIIRNASERQKPGNRSEASRPDKPQPVILASEEFEQSKMWSEIPVFIDSEPAKKNRAPQQREYSSRGPSWFKVIVYVMGAVMTGVFFGYLVLALFTGQLMFLGGEQGTTAYQTVEGQESAAMPGQAGDNGEPEPAATPDAGGVQAAAIASKRFYLIQAGVFSSVEGANTAIAALDEKGVAGAMLPGESYRVFAGLARSQAEAEQLATLLSGSEVYIKPVEWPAVTAFPYDGDGKDVEVFFAASSGLIEQLSALTNERLASGELAALGTAQLEQWRTAHKAWLDAAAAMQSGLNQAGKDELQHITTHLNVAGTAIEEFAKHPSRAHLWAIQTAIMEGFLAQKQWLEQIVGL